MKLFTALAALTLIAAPAYAGSSTHYSHGRVVKCHWMNGISSCTNRTIEEQQAVDAKNHVASMNRITQKFQTATSAMQRGDKSTACKALVDARGTFRVISFKLSAEQNQQLKAAFATGGDAVCEKGSQDHFLVTEKFSF